MERKKGGRPPKEQGEIVEGELKATYSDDQIGALVASGKWSQEDADYYREVRDRPTGSGGKPKTGSLYPDNASVPGSNKIGNVGSRIRKR